MLSRLFKNIFRYGSSGVDLPQQTYWYIHILRTHIQTHIHRDIYIFQAELRVYFNSFNFYLFTRTHFYPPIKKIKKKKKKNQTHAAFVILRLSSRGCLRIACLCRLSVAEWCAAILTWERKVKEMKKRALFLSILSRKPPLVAGTLLDNRKGEISRKKSGLYTYTRAQTHNCCKRKHHGNFSLRFQLRNRRSRSSDFASWQLSLNTTKIGIKLLHWRLRSKIEDSNLNHHSKRWWDLFFSRLIKFESWILSWIRWQLKIFR